MLVAWNVLKAGYFVKKLPVAYSNWHSENMTTMRHAPGAIRLCWHCDNQLRDQFTERLESMATDNCARWVLSVVRRDLGFDDSHVVTMRNCAGGWFVMIWRMPYRKAQPVRH